MAKLNTGQRKVTAPLATEDTPSGKTHEGHPGFKRDAKTELFLSATTTFAGEGNFYENPDQVDARTRELVRQLAVDDWPWVAGFLPWLRSEGNIRTASLALAAEAADAAGATPEGSLTPRQLVASVQLRGDEPGEMLQYALARWGCVPQAVKHGTGDAARRLYTERATLRWDKPDRPMRFADVIEICHPKPADDDQSALFRWLLTERHHPGAGEIPEIVEGVSEVLPGISARKYISAMTPAARHALAASSGTGDGWARRIWRIAAAGQWEFVRSSLGEAPEDKSGLSDREQWDLVIPDMGYMALLRNLRNFDHAGLRDSMVNKICQRLEDPREVERSRQLPFRFLSAHLNVPSLRWAASLEKALHLSVPNVPVLDGRTLILIDTSGSMTRPLSMRGDTQKGDARRRRGTEPKRPAMVMAAALFGLALALKNPGKVDVFGFANPPRPGSPGNFAVENIEFGSSLLKTTELFCAQVGRVGSGTAIAENLADTFVKGHHTRVVILTDEQTLAGGPGWGNGQMYGWYGVSDVTNVIPLSVPLYAWNLAGYEFGCFPTGPNRFALGGLTDHSFGIMKMLESGRDGDWPWQ